ncbi:hypothetical protein HYT58_01510, partial [Candidatus Woesearchaeota archaeon]|nr:hypothetical protein [Candidatus Woesearchaeota archaeon]
VLKESSDGLLKSAGLERFASFFSNPRKLLHIAYPNKIPPDVNLSEMPRLEEIKPLFNIKIYNRNRPYIRNKNRVVIFRATAGCPNIPAGKIVSRSAYYFEAEIIQKNRILGVADRVGTGCSQGVLGI